MHPLSPSGPAWPTLVSLGAVDEATWARCAAWLERHLPPGPHRDERVHWLTTPVALWLLHHLRAAPRRPLMVGLNAPQGAGKSTLASTLVGLFDELGLRAVSVSIDDFYLRRDEQLALAARHDGNPFLEHRGYPGTHDVALGARVLEALRTGVPVDVPRYDKTAHHGRGDRSLHVTPVTPPLDLVLVEGWMLGFEPVTRLDDPRLAPSNEALRDYEAWTRQLDVMVALRMARPEQVVRWRVEAEAATRRAGRPGLSDAEAEDYVRRFLPAYTTWGDTLGRGRWSDGRLLSLTLDADRVPVSAAPREGGDEGESDHHPGG